MSGAQQIGLFRRARVSSVERIDTEAGVGQSTDLSQTAETVRLLDLVVAGAHPPLYLQHHRSLSAVSALETLLSIIDVSNDGCCV